MQVLCGNKSISRIFFLERKHSSLINKLWTWQITAHIFHIIAHSLDSKKFRTQIHRIEKKTAKHELEKWSNRFIERCDLRCVIVCMQRCTAVRAHRLRSKRNSYAYVTHSVQFTRQFHWYIFRFFFLLLCANSSHHIWHSVYFYCHTMNETNRNHSITVAFRNEDSNSSRTLLMNHMLLSTNK